MQTKIFLFVLAVGWLALPLYAQYVDGPATYGTTAVVPSSGQTATLSTTGNVTVLPGGNLTYQATTRISLEPGFSVKNGGVFHARLITAGTQPTITAQPTSQTVTAGGSATFSVVASGSPTITYQWYKDGTAISSATSASLALSNVQSSQSGSYYVRVANSYGSLNSSSVSLTVNGGGGSGVATGGTITQVGSAYVHTFTSGGTFTVPSGGLSGATILLVGGGGGGGSGNSNGGGGGGGGGGVVYLTNQSISAGTYTIGVGAGGAGGDLNAPGSGANGGTSSALGYTATGGGGGGGYGYGGSSGGCGGGSGRDSAAAGGSGSQGLAGGRSIGTSWSSASGGGGAGGAGNDGGTDSTAHAGTVAAGGTGSAYDISGNYVYYAGGGGGSWGTGGGTAPAGGNGGGGAGSNGSGAGAAGSNGLGGGGGGGQTNTGGAGGSGVVIIRYSVSATGTVPTVASVSRTWTVGVAADYTITVTSGTATSYGASGLPPGMSVNSSTGYISGTPTTAGSYSVAITATNSAGTGNGTLTVTVNNSGGSIGLKIHRP